MAEVRLNRKSGTFRRSVRNSKGKIAKMLEFPAGEVVSVNGRDFDAIAPDIEKGALVEVTTEDGKVRPVKVPVAEPFEMTREQHQHDVDEARADGVREGQAQALEELVEA